MLAIARNRPYLARLRWFARCERTGRTGGIAEALIATAFGLLIAMIALLPFNLLNVHLELVRQEIEHAAAHLELVLLKSEKQASMSSVT
jgi:hypothetical protein